MAANKVLDDIEFQLREAWRDIANLRKEADRKTAHVDVLIRHGQRPLMMSDMPIAAWQAIATRFAAIGAAEELKGLARRRARRARNI